MPCNLLPLASSRKRLYLVLQAAMAAALQQQVAAAAGTEEVPSWAQALPQPSPLRTGKAQKPEFCCHIMLHIAVSATAVSFHPRTCWVSRLRLETQSISRLRQQHHASHRVTRRQV